MANENSAPPRAYRAPCPGCGAPVDFQSAQSIHAVCGYCQSTVVRSGDKLARIGKMAELFDDHSLLQLQASGVWNGQPFTLVGRLQYKYGEGTWTEWHAVLTDGSSAFLSEDNGAYVFGKAEAVQPNLPEAGRFRVGATTVINGKTFSVASNQDVGLMSAQGELPRLPVLGAMHAMVELRSPDGEVLSLDYSAQPPAVSRGLAVQLEDLKLTGLRDESVKDEKGGRAFSCPNCGASLKALLATTQSMTCGSCNSIIDLSKGIGGEIKHAVQDEPIQPIIPLGTRGQLQGVQWQVVGFQHRTGYDPQDSDEHFGWDEYLLYNARKGFTFLVDSSEGWSVVKPVTGAPVVAAGGNSAQYLGTRYQLKESYNAETSYVVGEFYWQVSRGQKTSNRDYTSGNNLLSMEQSPNELTWSVGSKIDSNAVAKAFNLEGKKELLARSDAGPISVAPDVSNKLVFVVFIAMILIALMMERCSSCDPRVENCASSGRTSGGSFGGFSGGGGHK